ncbi:MAG: S41 family peptidase [Alphaproteobacteria bacterium]
MKRYGYVGLGVVAGFVAAITLLPVAYGAPSILSAYRQLDLFGDAFERVRDNYVREVEDAELINAAIKGMVSSLDPHSTYLDAKSYSDMQVQTRGEFGGLGLEVTMEDGLVKVVAPIDDTPASRAGLKAGDYIAQIDGQPITGGDLNDAVEKMRGPEGSKVTLTILRKGEKKPFDVALIRAVIRIHSVKFRREGNIGYIRVTTFNERTASGMDRAIKELKREIGPSLKGYVIDLRNNPGGLLDQAISVSDDFLSGGEIVSTRGRRPQDTQRFNARGGDIADGKPIVVLINEGSASASEIVAGALQDHRRATVVGMKSFGKGSVQTIIPLGGQHGGALRLTTAKYYTPAGRSIQAAGIDPDIAVAQGPAAKLDTAMSLAERLRSEADLPNHLEGENNGKRAAKITVIRPEPGKKYDDFQLTFAMDRLNGRLTASVSQKEAVAQ